MSYYNGEKDPHVSGYAMIGTFMVDGGASRAIRLKSASDMSISSELEQARQFKNISLFMGPTKSHNDMKTALELSDAAVKKTVLSFEFEVQKESGRKTLEVIRLVDYGATIKKPPVIYGGNDLLIEVVLSRAELLHGKPSIAKPGYYDMDDF
jgi:hypothetical protein